MREKNITEAAALPADAAQAAAPDHRSSNPDLCALSCHLGGRRAAFVDRWFYFQQSIAGCENVCGYVRGRKHCGAHYEYAA